MSTNLMELKYIFDSIGKRYFADEARNRLLLPCNCGGNRIHVLVKIQEEGRFLQFVSTDFEAVPSDGPNASVLFQEMLAVNYETKFIKIARDPSDSEVRGYADFWVEDSDISAAQVG